MEAVRVMMSNREFWDSETLLLMQHPLFLWNKRLIQIRNERSRFNVQQKVRKIISRCEEMIDNKKTAESELIIADLIRKFPDMPEVYGLKAKVALKKGDYYSAANACRKALSFRPHDPKINYLLNIAKGELKMFSTKK